MCVMGLFLVRRPTFGEVVFQSFCLISVCLVSSSTQTDRNICRILEQIKPVILPILLRCLIHRYDWHRWPILIKSPPSYEWNWVLNMNMEGKKRLHSHYQSVVFSWISSRTCSGRMSSALRATFIGHNWNDCE